MADEKFEPFHGISTEGGNPTKCPKCGAGPEKWRIENYVLGALAGDIYCECGEYIRMYSA
jgi:hypothetical protein